MKKLPEVEHSFGAFYGMIIAPIRSKLMLTGIELKVFNHLSESGSADAVAEAIGAHPRNTRLFLDGLAAIDLIQKRDGLYRNSPTAQAFLVEESPTYLGQFLTHMAMAASPLDNLLELVKEGPPPPPETPPFSDEMLAQGVPILASTELAGEAQMVSQLVSDLPEFPSFRKMLDLGGGPGLIGMAIIDVHPNMRGVIFDLPPVVEMAKGYIKEYEMDERVEVLSGDFNRDPIGEGYDLVLACNSLQFATDIDTVVKKVYDALNSGGVFVSIFPFGQTHEGTKPESTVLGLLPLALMGHDTGLQQGFVANSMLRVGFRSVHSKTWNTNWGPMDLDIARK